MEKNNFKKILIGIKEYLLIAVGLLLYAGGVSIFIIPNELVGGGVTGISALLLYAFNIPVSWSFFGINLILLAIALKVLGKGFGVKTVYAIIVASLFFDIFPRILPADSDFVQAIALANGKLLSAIIAGVCCGVGIAITFMQGGSTGGTDIIALMINKYRNIPPGKIILSIDIIIIACVMLLPDESGNAVNWGMKIATVMYGYVVTFVVGYSLDLTLSGSRQSMQIFIFSKEYEKIADAITADLHRGVTVIDGEGWYTKTEGKILLVIVRKTEINQVFKIIREIDPNAFTSSGAVSGVYGQGFERMKK